MITKEALNERMGVIHAEIEQFKSNLVKLEGHLNECTYWLMELAKQEAKQQVAKEKAALEANEPQPLPEEQAA